MTTLHEAMQAAAPQPPQGEKAAPQKDKTVCNPHPDAPHGFSRDASHSVGRYVCDCEGWMPDDLDEFPPRRQ